jgi:2-oxoglutarate dehydrogenase E1 component
MMRNGKTSFLYGGNAPYVEEQYELYLADSAAVPNDWRDYFDALQTTPAGDGTDAIDVAHGPVVDRFVEIAKGKRPADTATTTVTAKATEDTLSFARKQVAVQALIAAYRMVGTRKARLDPLRWAPLPAMPDLAPGFYGLTPADMATKFSTADTYFSDEDTDLASLVKALEETYCGTLSSEFMHLADANHRRWWQMRLESTRAKPTHPAEKQLHILERLTAAEGLEKYLHNKYVGQKRFSLEGGESLIVLLDEIVRSGAARGVKNVVMGMAHRGRLNVLINIAGKPAARLFEEFNGKVDTSLLAGDVKYHKGYTGTTQTEHGPVEVLLAFNASHLEIVNPVVQGISRAKQDERADAADSAVLSVLPVEIHGDAAMSGQGIVMETLNLANTRGHGTGGTVHVVVNNQVGFTTSDPRDARSSFYCTDIAKMIDAPVLHVNGDDPEAVVLAVQLALEYRTTFARSVVIDLVCFRRHGHQEQDTPNMTQPLMYRAISNHPGVRELYARSLIERGVVSADQASALSAAYRAKLEAEQAQVQSGAGQTKHPDSTLPLGHAGSVYYAGPQREHLQSLARRITELPADYRLHPLVAKLMTSRREMAEGKKALDWGMGEHLAYASLLSACVDVRLSGQDSERGTFGHRHAVLHDQLREARGAGTYTPLNHVDGEQGQQGRFTVTNSVLSEAAVLAFEYGYSVTRGQNALVLWEAQFGDFANGAQVVIDQFISAGTAKWGQRSGVTLLLPHGQEGQGPEHASARLERYLQLCAQDNMRVCQPTTPAQFFHLLRMQALLPDQRPLIVMTPKSLLRHPGAVSTLEELSAGAFQEVIGDSSMSPEECAQVERVVLCTGKVYYELLERRRAKGHAKTAIIRVEQLYPFPHSQLRAELARYPNAGTVVWCQEEARNQGAWTVIESDLRTVIGPDATLQYAGPDAAASTASGYASEYARQQEKLGADAFGEHSPS